MARTPTQLRQYADEHLLYEIWMVAALAQRMTRHATLFDSGLSPRHGALAKELLDLAGRNADIESFATHLRNLVQFLYPHKPKGGTVIAANYFATSGDWTSIRPARPPSLMVVNQRVPIEIAHLGFGRLERRDKTWSYRDIWLDLAKVLEVFASNVPDGRVSSEFRGAVKELLSSAQKVPLTQELEALKEVVSDMSHKSLVAGLGATTAPEVLVQQSEEPTAGTATKLPPRPASRADYDSPR